MGDTEERAEEATALVYYCSCSFLDRMPHSRYFACYKICKVCVLLMCILHGSAICHKCRVHLLHICDFQQPDTLHVHSLFERCAHQYHLHWTPVAHYPAGKTLCTSENLPYNIVDSSMLAYCFTQCKQ